MIESERNTALHNTDSGFGGRRASHFQHHDSYPHGTFMYADVQMTMNQLLDVYRIEMIGIAAIRRSSKSLCNTICSRSFYYKNECNLSYRHVHVVYNRMISWI
jgi:hypothetical protein